MFWQTMNKQLDILMIKEMTNVSVVKVSHPLLWLQLIIPDLL